MLALDSRQPARPTGGENLWIQRVALPASGEIKQQEGGIWFFKKVSDKYKRILERLDDYHINAGNIKIQQDLLALLIRDIDAWHQMKEKKQKKGAKKTKPDKRADVLKDLKTKAQERKSEILELLVSEEQEGAFSKGRSPLTQEQLQIPGRHVKHLVPIAQLEKDDPLHREAVILGKYLKLWIPGGEKKEWILEKDGPPPPAYYHWVTEQEHKWDKNLEMLVHSHVRTKLRPPVGVSRDEAAQEWIEERKKKGNGELIPRIQYLQAGKDSQTGREKYRLNFKGTQLSNTNEGDFENNKRYIFAMSPGMDFFSTRESGATTLERHHSSFFSGGGVASAGIFKPSGYLNVSIGSGHYHPEQQHMVNALVGLKRHQVPLDKVTAKPVFDAEDVGIRGHLYLKLIDVLKSMHTNLFRFLKRSNSYPDIKNAFLRKTYDESFAEDATRVISACDSSQLDNMKNAKK